MKVLDYVFAARPLLHLPIWSVYLVSLHYHHRLSGEQFLWHDLLIMAGISMLFAGAAFLNQVYDYDSDLVNRKLGFLQRNLIAQHGMMRGFWIVSVPPLLLAGWSSGALLFLFAQFVLLAYLYSTPPWRMKDRPIWGVIANAWPHGLLVPFCVMPDISIHNAGLLGGDTPLYFFCAVAAT
ncbi:MAG: UbiA family prenyltransferase, partial [candidate division Zixibacteria bacterium]|nr:UbiA family prenyltransferase [candidate division Zixibacteria bacterium]